MRYLKAIIDALANSESNTIKKFYICFGYSKLENRYEIEFVNGCYHQIYYINEEEIENAGTFYADKRSFIEGYIKDIIKKFDSYIERKENQEDFLRDTQAGSIDLSEE